MELLHQCHPKLWQNDVLPLLINLYTVQDITDVWLLLNRIASVTSHVKLIKLRGGSTFDGLRTYYNQLNNKDKSSFLSTIKAI